MASQLWIFERFHWKLEYHIGLQQIELKHFESFATTNSLYFSCYSRFCRQGELKRLTRRSEQLPKNWCCNFESNYDSQSAKLSLNQFNFLYMAWTNNAFSTATLSERNHWNHWTSSFQHHQIFQNSNSDVVLSPSLFPTTGVCGRPNKLRIDGRIRNVDSWASSSSDSTFRSNSR